MVLGIKWYHHVQNDDVRRTIEQWPLSAIVQARRLSLFSHTECLPNETDAKKILAASPYPTIQQDLESFNLSWMKYYYNHNSTLKTAECGQQKNVIMPEIRMTSTSIQMKFAEITASATDQSQVEVKRQKLGLHRIWLFQIRPKPNLAEFWNSNSTEAEFGWNLFSGQRTIRQW